MIIQSYSLLDIVSGLYGFPFSSTSDATAVRSVQTEMANPNSGPLHTHPQDYRLYHVGSFDNETGAWTPLTPAVMLPVPTPLP